MASKPHNHARHVRVTLRSRAYLLLSGLLLAACASAATPLATPTPSATATPPAGESVVWGDNNCSGSANPVDSLLTLRHDAGLSANTGSCPRMGAVVDVQNASSHAWGDVDCGGDVTPVDSLKLLRYDAGLSVTQEASCPATGSDVLLVEASAACIPSGDQDSIQSALAGPGSKGVLCPNAVFELSETVYFTADGQSIYTEGLPTDSTRAFLKVVGVGMATAVSGEGNDDVSLRNVIVDGNRPQLGLAEGALLNFGRGVEDHNVEGQVIEWVKAYEPRGWTVLYFGGPCRGAAARNNEFGPAGRAEYVIADGISLECPNSVVENNTIIDATDGGIVIFQSPGSLIANNTIRAEDRIMFYGISMEDYHPLEGDFTGTRVTGNVIDAAGSMIRRGIGMGPYVGCAPEDENAPRSRGAIVTDNTLMGDHMAYGFVVSGVEDWTLTGNVDLSTHLAPEREGDCSGNVVDPPGGFQYNSVTSSGTFQPEFEAAVLGGSTEMFPLQAVASEACVSDLIGAAVFEDMKAGSLGELWPALETAPNGERIEECISIYQPPDISDLSGHVGLELLSCTPNCVELRLFNLSDDTANLQRAEFLLDDFLVPCLGLPASLGPWEEAHCTVEDFVIAGFHVFRWYGFQPGGDMWVFNYPLEDDG